ncbi:S-adenosylmethionine:tRNA ribosyltransferase-isomerase [Aureimonas altamirensis DSM 21988]|uniref:S-adenosylmethionine:tRNA ribosyltransferase-isomerase n=2 Tax=Aureimonas altamirensis TaxID=370622 RepID=A0A0P0YXT4_9HYPH|nr:tRNA preQ1(34) S-adenosylmethionine ribosyltransferase-isomerase QueA [Aureimonas altamirensis]BAT26300.1 tRNA-ribosyltransferase-isomerase [Aureimonas altamirensis]SHJ43561.1 S-adenosylmethionine:tRNA ribosyltransferase-isomerase [Aureimonas altamirensis DSM 21988]
MRVDLFDFDLPEERIALRPALPRESAKLLHVPSHGAFEDRRVGDLPDLLRPGDCLVFNDTRVIPARLAGVRRRGDTMARVEVTLHMRLGADEWRAFVKPAKRIDAGETLEFGDGALTATIADKRDGGEVTLRFDRSGAALDAAIAEVGILPLPPYIAARRAVDAQDSADYQTIYAREEGAVAAPTAGLHFTPELMAHLQERGVETAFVTLHVGAGTFLPVKADDTAQHRMHAEIGEIDATTADRLNAARKEGRRIVAVGTTSLRLLESAADEDGTLHPFRKATDIFITPGYRFRAVDALWTNFHLPRSTLFMLVSAFSGLERMRAAYEHAIAGGYRFYSYGDACLLERA